MSDITAPPFDAVTRLRAALADSEALFTSSQLVYLMATAGRWATDATAPAAYEAGERDGRAHVGELVLAALGDARTVPVFTERWHRMEGYRIRARREHDIAARFPWHGDHPGGRVPDWDYDDLKVER